MSQLSAEMRAEIERRHGDSSSGLSTLNVGQVTEIVDVVTGVIARHAESRIVSDTKVPVTPLPFKGE